MMVETVIGIIETGWQKVITAPTPAMSVVVLMVAVLFSAFLFRLTVRRHRIRAARSKIPFVIGGWGTRGKSGTERKKAALFEGLGYHVLSKTTGCEAMIIHARPGQNAVELPIYRPGDKASIWEQARVVDWAGHFNSQILLWECMALGPDYASTLQHDWMNDAISTLSNTFVDHENIQGPTGMDVTRALTSFIPINGVLLTAETNMLPVIADVCRARETRLIDLAWNESDLIGDDVLEQFPYSVHPRNLGMVLKMARHLGIDETVALREIARNIIPDLGSFKSYRTRFKNRYLEFWNGFSANDRISTVENWQKAGFYDLAPGKPAWKVSIINNRDDRIIRSREFSEIIVNDTPAHLHILIGTNLSGFFGYIQESIREFAGRKTLIGENQNPPYPPELIDQMKCRALRTMQKLGVEALDRDAIRTKLSVMLGLPASATPVITILRLLLDHATPDIKAITRELDALTIDPETRDDITTQLIRDMQDLRAIETLFSHLAETGTKESLAAAALHSLYRQTLIDLLTRRIHIISNPFLSGDQVLHRVVRCLPPNYRIKLMGMQNIKGTGLDFAHRWVSLDKVQNAVLELESDLAESRQKALDFLYEYDDYGIMDAPLAIHGLKQFRSTMQRDNADFIPQIDSAISRVQSIVNQRMAAVKSVSGHRGWRKTAIWILEQLQEAGDSKRRKRQSNLVMKDLFAQRISHARARKVLHDIKKRQEGGWLQDPTLS
ncbi:poly-gamma-glutamate synthase PgsB [bacterium]|nr:poly-gamma-glutamate synthase PgsB [candidate division CSSED10-310 bacterium]